MIAWLGGHPGQLVQLKLAQLAQLQLHRCAGTSRRGGWGEAASSCTAVLAAVEAALAAVDLVRPRLDSGGHERVMGDGGFYVEAEGVADGASPAWHSMFWRTSFPSYQRHFCTKLISWPAIAAVGRS